MAIIDTNANNWYQIDKDEDQYIGLSLPLILDNGQEASTKTTLEAVKNNLLNLCNTEMGERPMQPLLGIKLKQFIFEQYNDESKIAMQNEILDTLKTWLPFVEIKGLDISMNETDAVGKNKMLISIIFNIIRDPNTLESTQVEIGG